jgi:hypothetical protein
MQGVGQFEVAKGMCEAAADVLSVRFDALLLKPTTDLGIADDRGTSAFGYGHCIADVVAVAVGDEDVVRADLVSGGGGFGVAREERIDQDVNTIHVQSDSRVSVESK